MQQEQRRNNGKIKEIIDENILFLLHKDMLKYNSPLRGSDCSSQLREHKQKLHIVYLTS